MKIYIKKEKIKSICPICNKEFLGKKGQITCSNHCSQLNYSHLHPKPKVDRYRLDNPKRDKICPFCNILFRDNSRQNSMKFCCEEHSNRYYKKNIAMPKYYKSRETSCIVCKDIFIPKRYLQTDLPFCSKECMIISKFVKFSYMIIKDEDYPHSDGRFRVYCTRTFINEVINSLLNNKNKTYNWTIPNILENKKMVAQFLSGFFDGEGTVNISKKRYISIQCYSVNENGLKEVGKLLSEFNIHYTTSRLNRKGLQICLNKKICYGKSDIYAIIISKYNDINRFYNQIGFKIKRKNDKIKKFLETFEYEKVPKEINLGI